MKPATLFFALIVATAGPATAQTTPPPPPSPDAPVAGANSFTEAQARERIAAAGFTDIGALVKSSAGIWHGPANKGDLRVEVSVDYQGNVTSH